ncbi:MAG: biotin-dependent carboxyltransferase family protein [Parasphingorhabdus sp.]|uniref:5-oxoprolinase subunit C family protein n=1 Tax=Parasphingorhabdus sp. TaxID=2709688 RepID=UPI00329A5CB5
MTLSVIKAGLQTSLQGAPYKGHRHLGMPAAGAADCLSLALANKLVGKSNDALALEMTLDDAKFRAEQPMAIALTGAADYFHINGQTQPLHQRILVEPDDEIHIGPARHGCRSYLALGGAIAADTLLGGQSTIMSVGLGGFEGRALQMGDHVQADLLPDALPKDQQTPAAMQPVISDKFIIRLTTGPEFHRLSNASQNRLFDQIATVGARANRMGLNLQGLDLDPQNAADIKSAAVFPGTIQCPPDGQAYLLGSDAQTTGGYARIAQVIRADRHMIGQMRSGANIQFVHITTEQAAAIYRQKLALVEPWLGTMNFW